MSNQLSSYDAEVSQHMQSKDAREFFANSMVALNVYVGADINKELPEALETQIRRIESIQYDIEDDDYMEGIAMDVSPFEFLDWACDDLLIFLRWALKQRVSLIGCRIPAQKAYTGRFWDEDWDEERFKNAPRLQGPELEAETQHDAILQDAIAEDAVQKPEILNAGYEGSGSGSVGSQDERGNEEGGSEDGQLSDSSSEEEEEGHAFRVWLD